jgi:hypothetical protein
MPGTTPTPQQFDARTTTLGLAVPADRRDAAVAGAQWLADCVARLADWEKRKRGQGAGP